MNSGNPNADPQGNRPQTWHTNAPPNWQPHAAPHALPQAHYTSIHNGPSHQGGFVPPPCGFQAPPQPPPGYDFTTPACKREREMLRAGHEVSSAYVPPQPPNSFQAPRPSPNVFQTPHQPFHGFHPYPQTLNSFQQPFAQPGNFQPAHASPNGFQQPFRHPQNPQAPHASPNGFQQPFPHPGNRQPPRVSPNSFQQPPQPSSNDFQRPPQPPNGIQTTFPPPQNPQAPAPSHTPSTHAPTPSSPSTAAEASRKAGLDLMTTMTTLSALDQKRVRHLEAIIDKLLTRCSNYKNELQQEKAKAAKHRQEHATCRDPIKQFPPTPKSTHDKIALLSHTEFDFSTEDLLAIGSFDSQLDAIMLEYSGDCTSQAILGPLASAPVSGDVSASPAVRPSTSTSTPAQLSTSLAENPHGKKRPHAQEHSAAEPREFDVRFPDGTAVCIPNPAHAENEPAKKKGRRREDKDTGDVDVEDEEFLRDWEVYLELNAEAGALLEKFDEQVVVAQGCGN